MVLIREDKSATPVALHRLQLQDVGRATEIYLEAFGSSRSGRLGAPYARAYLRWFIAEPTAVTLGAWVEGELLGFAVGAPLGYQRKLNRDLALTVVRCLLARPRLFLDGEILGALVGRLRVLLRRRSTPPETIRVPEPTMCFVGAGLAERARGLGLGARLYRGFQEECRTTTNARSLRGITHKDNIPPSRILASLGWQPLYEDSHGYISWYKVFDSESGSPGWSLHHGPDGSRR